VVGVEEGRRTERGSALRGIRDCQFNDFLLVLIVIVIVIAIVVVAVVIVASELERGLAVVVVRRDNGRYWRWPLGFGRKQTGSHVLV
jgi:hypothetical protein